MLLEQAALILSGLRHGLAACLHRRHHRHGLYRLLLCSWRLWLHSLGCFRLALLRGCDRSCHWLLYQYRVHGLRCRRRRQRLTGRHILQLSCICNRLQLHLRQYRLSARLLCLCRRLRLRLRRCRLLHGLLYLRCRLLLCLHRCRQLYRLLHLHRCFLLLLHCFRRLCGLLHLRRRLRLHGSRTLLRHDHSCRLFGRQLCQRALDGLPDIRCHRSILLLRRRLLQCL